MYIWFKDCEIFITDGWFLTISWNFKIKWINCFKRERQYSRNFLLKCAKNCSIQLNAGSKWYYYYWIPFSFQMNDKIFHVYCIIYLQFSCQNITVSPSVSLCHNHLVCGLYVVHCWQLETKRSIRLNVQLTKLKSYQFNICSVSW